jgi:hypothetical protein
LDENNLPVNMLKWVGEYKRQIRFIREQTALKSTRANSDWMMLENGGNLEKVSSTAVSPLMTTTWSQSPYYNDLCPQASLFSEKAVTGCVATAMAQVMKYHNYPKQGRGIHTYYHSKNTVTYGNLSANFGATTYDWSNMPDALSASSSATNINAVATLMLHCGIGVDMNYGPGGSGAYVIEDKSYGSSCSEYALKEFFGYDESTVRGVEREGMTTNEWIILLKNELDANRPILFAGFGGDSGHAFVADGYDNNNYFHMNWGWGGIADGYFHFDAFEPSDLGTGAGYGTYNDNQCVVIGIQPPDTEIESDLRLFSPITVPEIYQFNEFRIELKIANFGDQNFYGELVAALFDEDGDFVEFIETFTVDDAGLESGYWYDTFFDSEGISAYPGNYYIGIYSKSKGENWVSIADGDYQNFIVANVLSPFENTEITIFDSIKVNPDPLIVGEPLRIDTKIANYGSTDYSGEFGAGLFFPDGELAQQIDIFDVSIDGGYYSSIWYDNNSVDVEPGSYIVGLVHYPANSDEQIVIAPGDFLNPVRVNVTLPPIGPDGFENNDDPGNASLFNVEFEDNYSGFYTVETNLHNEADEDYYMMELPQGYSYTISARVHDSYSSEIDEEFTLDVIWAHSDNGEWSQMYDDEMDAPYVLQNGGEVYFGVIPYFEGNTGTYSLSVEIQREVNTSVHLIADEDFKVFPNPATDRVEVTVDQVVTNYHLYDQMGRMVLSGFVNRKNFSIDLSSFQQGIYHLSLICDTNRKYKKIIINE